MKKFYFLGLFLIFSAFNLQAQDPTPGVFVGPPELVRCGNTALPTAAVTYKFAAKNYQEAREIGESIRWRFQNLYTNLPSYLREYYVCKSSICESDRPCWANAEVIEVRAVKLIPLSAGVYLLKLEVDYKVQCLDCNK